MDNFTIEKFDLSKARDDKEIYLDGNYYKSFFVLDIDGTAEMGFSRSGDRLVLGTEINKMTGLSSFDSVYLTNQAQEGKELKIIFGQNLGSETLEAFSQLSQFGVDVNSTPALKAGELNLDGDKDLQVDIKASPDLKASELNIDGEKDLQVDIKTSPDLQASELNLDVNDNVGTNLNAENIDLITKIDNMITLLQDIKTNTSA